MREPPVIAKLGFCELRMSVGSFTAEVRTICGLSYQDSVAAAKELRSTSWLEG